VTTPLKCDFIQWDYLRQVSLPIGGYMKNNVRKLLATVLLVFAGIVGATIMGSLGILSSYSTLYAAPNTRPVPIFLDGEQVTFTGQEPIMVDGRVLVPIELFEKMGYEIGWADDETYLMISDGWRYILLHVDEPLFIVEGGGMVYPDVPHQIINGQLMLPLRAIMEAFLWGDTVHDPSIIEEIRAIHMAAGENLPWWDPIERAVYLWALSPWQAPLPWITPTHGTFEPNQVIGDPIETLYSIQERFPTVSGLDNTCEPQYGGILRVGLASNNHLAGSYNSIFTTGSLEAELMAWFGGNSSVFSTTPYRTFGQSGIVTWDYCLDSRSMHLIQVADVYWHDNHPLTLNDLVFAHEMIAHPDYLDAGGTRWSNAQQNIVGAWEYHKGEAGYISGLVLSDDERELTIYFIDFPPSIHHFGFWSTPYPRHIFQDVPLSEQRFHYHSTVRPIGWGPFIVDYYIPGEGMILVANDCYWQGRPYVDSVEIMVVQWDLIPFMMEAGYLDIAPMGTWGFTTIPEPENFSYLGVVDNFFSSLNFNLGYWDEATSQVIPRENTRMGDARLRRAMAFAIDESYLTANLYSGMRVPATSIVPPRHRQFHIPGFAGFYYDPIRAKAYLDEAGFMVGPDGWRTDPDGNEFIIHFLVPHGPDMEVISGHYLYSWESIGLQVYLERMDAFIYNSEMINTHSERNFDIAPMSWIAGFDPNPHTLWGHSVFNIPRFMSEDFQRVLEGFNSPEAWDLEWLTAHFHEWQRLFFESAPALPGMWRVSLTAVNNRVVGHDISGVHEDDSGPRGGLHRIWVTER